MTPLGSARRRAEEFDAVLDGRSQTSSDNQVFLELVQQLQAVEAPAMRAEFAADLRARLLAAAPQELAVPSTARPVVEPETRRGRLLSIAAASCIVVGSGVGVAAASQSALPGDPLYGVKRGIERVDLATADSAADRGETLLDQARNRLDEVEALAVDEAGDPATPEHITQALDDFIVSATDGGESMVDAYRSDSDESAISELREFTSESAASLDQLADVVPAATRDELLDAAKTLTTLDEAARLLCPICSDLPGLVLSPAMVELTNLAAFTPSSAPAQVPAGVPASEQPARQPHATGPTAGPGMKTPVAVEPTTQVPPATIGQPAPDEPDNPIRTQPPADLTKAPIIPTQGVITTVPTLDLQAVTPVLPSVTLLPLGGEPLLGGTPLLGGEPLL